jgi:hypothetical protein
MDKWLITHYQDANNDEIYRKMVLQTYNDSQIALEEFRAMYMKQILKRNIFNSFNWDAELECYGPDIIDAIHHTPKKRYSYYLLENLEIDTWEFNKKENQELYLNFLKFIEESNVFLSSNARVRTSFSVLEK